MRAILIAAAWIFLAVSAQAATVGTNYSCDGVACTCTPDGAGGSSSSDCKNLGGSGKCSGEIHCWCGWAVCSCACWKKMGLVRSQTTPYTPGRGGLSKQPGPGLLEGGTTLQPQGPGPAGTVAPPRAPGGGGRIN